MSHMVAVSEYACTVYTGAGRLMYQFVDVEDMEIIKRAVGPREGEKPVINSEGYVTYMDLQEPDRYQMWVGQSWGDDVEEGKSIRDARVSIENRAAHYTTYEEGELVYAESKGKDTSVATVPYNYVMAFLAQRVNYVVVPSGTHVEQKKQPVFKQRLSVMPQSFPAQQHKRQQQQQQPPRPQERQPPRPQPSSPSPPPQKRQYMQARRSPSDVVREVVGESVEDGTDKEKEYYARLSHIVQEVMEYGDQRVEEADSAHAEELKKTKEELKKTKEELKQTIDELTKTKEELKQSTEQDDEVDTIIRSATA